MIDTTAARLDNPDIPDINHFVRESIFETLISAEAIEGHFAITVVVEAISIVKPTPVTKEATES
jgi:hypothetical protein